MSKVTLLFLSFLQLPSLGIASDGCATSMVYSFESLPISRSLQWTPCYDDFTCTRLEVPIDYSDPSTGTTNVAFIKMAGRNATEDAQTIVLANGGPGSSGVDLLLSFQSTIGQIFGEQYNYVSFDPRGVNNSGLVLDCFSGNEEARSAFNELYRTGVPVTNNDTLQTQYYASRILGKWCNNAAQESSNHSYYVTTPAVAQDLLTYIEAEAESFGRLASDAKLWLMAFSYGTVVGSTFASLYPERVGRIVLDGVLDAEEYYTNDWKASLTQMDESLLAFSTFCHQAGPTNCSFWGPSAENITSRIDNIMAQLKSSSVPIPGVETNSTPVLVTYSDLKSLFIQVSYSPLTLFPSMADILHEFEAGNPSPLSGLAHSFDPVMDWGDVIKCVDPLPHNKLVSVTDFANYIDYATSTSKYLGDIFPIFVRNIVCQEFAANLPDNMFFPGTFPSPSNHTAFPIMFASNTIDALTPIISAHKMSGYFPGSVVVAQEAVGHVVALQGGSPCYFQLVQEYFAGIVPQSNTTCPRAYVPFKDSAPF
ncbi:alpha/beta-hydrolase [Xylariaceae sp. FL0016]|nr:alpha/beta-hydrolase [Xylariaceae sp. FL0016]